MAMLPDGPPGRLGGVPIGVCWGQAAHQALHTLQRTQQEDTCVVWKLHFHSFLHVYLGVLLESRL